MSEDSTGATDLDAPSRGAARTMNTLAMLVLAGASLAVLAAAAPALFRATLPASSGAQRAMVAHGASRPPRRSSVVPRSHPRFDPLAADDDPSDGDPSTGNIDTAPGEPKAGPIFMPEDPSEAPRSSRDPSGADRPESVRLGLARTALKLRQGPRDGGEVLGEIRAGEQVVVLRESGDWSLIVHGGRMGWTRKSEIAVR